MKRSAWVPAAGLVSGWITFTLAASPSASQSAGAPVAIRPNEPQLFVDDRLIADSRGLERTLHQPIKDAGGEVPIIPPPPGSETLLARGTILFDPRLGEYVMFAKARPSTRIHRFVSRDGLQ